MWRWSYMWSAVQFTWSVFSTYVEVILRVAFYGFHQGSILHVCGGDPKLFILFGAISSYSPRMWRWSLFGMNFWPVKYVFSTYVEVILSARLGRLFAICILHVCGGDPYYDSVKALQEQYSPRMWRWSPFVFLIDIIRVVFSTYVEVILEKLLQQRKAFCILHVCGGDPVCNLPLRPRIQYSPRMWRWSSIVPCIVGLLRVFSTYVEVILIFWISSNVTDSILHVCGGDPLHGNPCLKKSWYSPRMWRWS